MNVLEIEKKWQNFWDTNKTFIAENNSPKPKYYYLIEFPYPSGAGLHVGHVRSQTALDAMARKKRREGFNVLYPIGWDAFGLPTEQFAIKNKIHPTIATEKNIKTFKEQIKRLGISFDWSREFSTTEPDYYKWTQWQFLKFVEHKMAYKAKKEINWCPNCKIGLANEEAEGNVCERCGGEIVKREKEQWMLKMSSYADKLLDGLNDTEFVDRVKTAQINWIGKSQGANIKFKLNNLDDCLEVFTTRPDTLFGVTFMVMAVDHPFIKKYSNYIKNLDEALAYQKISLAKTDIERTDNTKEKTGVKLIGLEVIHPVKKDCVIPIYISDYVLSHYGTGAIMAVPAHDTRDFEFATKFNIPIIPVIKSLNEEEMGAFTGDGEVINSDFLNGINNKEEAISKMIEYLESQEIGSKKTTYRLQDWVFSRQRFWGEPIPMINCPKCGWVSVPEKDLPVILPNVANYLPTDNGDSPLAAIEEFVNCTCPVCGQKAKRETDTMPNWAGSSWYYLRYMDSQNNKDFVSLEANNYWNMVDYYNGGMEHATRHLLYARFWHRFLYDIGLISYPEPFKKRVAHGMILGQNGEKMSKSKGNVINPDEMINKYGSDALRTYEMFIGDYEQDCSWNEQGLNGCKRFLDRVERLALKVLDNKEYNQENEILINQTIKKVTEDIENMKYNTAISSLMILLNELEKLDQVTSASYEILLSLLNPFAPHITEELNEIYLKEQPICYKPWPKYDETKLEANTYEMVVQVNGKVRGKINIKTNTSKEEMLSLAKQIENVQTYITGKTIIKEIVIVKKLVNIVVQ